MLVVGCQWLLRRRKEFGEGSGSDGMGKRRRAKRKGLRMHHGAERGRQCGGGGQGRIKDVHAEWRVRCSILCMGVHACQGRQQEAHKGAPARHGGL